jgi:molybdopterin-synthase adenylyltransferase
MDERYTQQVLLDKIAKRGQEKLQQSTVAIVGVGALGTNAAELLVRAGVNVLLIDNDKIEKSNLQRQTLFEESDVGKSKVETAKEKLIKINSSVNVEIKEIRLNEENTNIINNVNLVLDCTDNMETRFLINKYCLNKIPWIYSAAIETRGMVMPILPNGPCLNCVMKESKLETCNTVGVLNTIITSIASLQVTLAFKILIDEIEPFLYHQDLWTGEFRKIKVKKSCKNCV